MNYSRIYNKLIENAKHRQIIDGYKEIHHINPKCLGGTNDETNLVNLTAREHFLAHWLLVKIYPKNFKLLAAWNAFCRTNEPGRTVSRLYEYCRLRWMKVLKERKITEPEWYERWTKSSLKTKWMNKNGKNYRAKEYELDILLDDGWNLGRITFKRRPHSEEHRKKLSEKLKGKPGTWKGKKIPKEIIDKMVKTRIENGSYVRTEEQNEKLSKALTGRKLGPLSEKRKKQIGEQKSKLITCPHCNKTGANFIMSRWHFDKCKQNPKNGS